MPVTIKRQVDQKAIQFISELEARAYQRGVDDTVAAITTAIQSVRDGIASEQVEQPTEIQRALKILKRTRKTRENSVQAQVLKAVQEAPGNRGIGLIRYLATKNIIVNERTVRTALRRLKKRGVIYMNAEGDWYPKKER